MFMWCCPRCWDQFLSPLKVTRRQARMMRCDAPNPINTAVRIPKGWHANFTPIRYSGVVKPPIITARAATRQHRRKGKRVEESARRK